MEHFMALYAAFTGEEILPVQIPVFAQQLKVTFCSRFLHSIPTTIILIPTGYALLYLAEWLSNKHFTKDVEFSYRSVSDEDLALRRTDGHHNLHAYFLGDEEENEREQMRKHRSERTLEWVDWVRNTQFHSDSDDTDTEDSSDEPIETYICESCIHCISKSDYEDYD